MVSRKMTKSINNQINAELYSAYLYMAMAAYASFKGLKGAANWFTVQAKEEMIHAQKFYDYLISQGSQIVLAAIDQPPTQFRSLEDLFRQTLSHEQKVTGLINGLARLARDENDNATGIFLQWFVTEQIEEEESARDIVDKVKLIGNDGPALLMLDKELAARIFTPPAVPQA